MAASYVVVGIPKFTYYSDMVTIDSTNNTLLFQENGTPAVLTATIESGRWDYVALGYKIKKAMEAASSAAGVNNKYRPRFNKSLRSMTIYVTTGTSWRPMPSPLSTFNTVITWAAVSVATTSSTFLGRIRQVLRHSRFVTWIGGPAGTATMFASAQAGTVAGLVSFNCTAMLRSPRPRLSGHRGDVRYEDGGMDSVWLGRDSGYRVMLEHETVDVIKSIYDLLESCLLRGGVANFYPDYRYSDYAVVQSSDSESAFPEMAQMVRQFAIQFNLRLANPNTGTIKSLRALLDRR